MENQSERGWRAGVTGNGRGLTGVSSRPARWAVSDGLSQIPPRFCCYRLFGAVNWHYLDLLRGTSRG